MKQQYDRETVRKRLQELADPAYREFQSQLIPGEEHIVGVRVPQLRALAKEIARGDWEAFLREDDRCWYETILLQGLVIGYARMEFSQKLAYIREFVPKIHNWAVCDIFCNTLKETKKEKQRMREFLEPYLCSEKEFEIRFGVVMLLSHYMEAEDVAPAFAAFDQITSQDYYARMAVAWAVSVYFVHFPDSTWEYLLGCRLDDWTFHKAIQKIMESYRVDSETKKKLRKLKR